MLFFLSLTKYNISKKILNVSKKLHSYHTFHANCGRLAQQKETEFLDIINRNQGIIHRVCRLYTDSRDEHNDLFQEIMTQLWIGYQRFQHDSKVSTWMYRVALYTAITYIKKVMKQRKVMHELMPYQQTAEIPADGDSEEEKLWRAIKQLSDKDRALVTLYLDGMSYQEMSKVIGITESNVGARINRIKKKLKQTVQQWN